MIQIGNAELMRELNTNRLLNTIVRSQPISQVELSEVTGLSFPTVSRIVNDLRRKEVLVEHSRAKSSGGRRPRLLRINPEANYVVGIDVDIDETVIGLLDIEGNIKSFEIFATHPDLGPDILIDNLNLHIERMISGKGLSKSKVMGIGVALPGKVEPAKGILIYSVNLNWRDVPLKEMVYKKIKIDTVIEGDAQSMALGEHFFGNARDVDNLAWVNVAGGVGVGIIEKGTIYRGAHGNAGEVGHITVMRNGPPCSCGRRGCLETMVGSSAVLSRLAKTIDRGEETLISDFVHGRLEDLRVLHIFLAAKEEDKLASEVVEEMAYYLGIGLSMIANLMDPGLIVVGGPVIDSGGDEFFEMVQRFAINDIMPERIDKLVIKRSALSGQAGASGAASLVFQEKFKLPVMK